MNNETITFHPLPKKAMTDQQFKLELSRFSIKQREERGRFNYFYTQCTFNEIQMLLIVLNKERALSNFLNLFN